MVALISLDGTTQPFLASVYSVHSYLATTPVPYLPFTIFSVIHAVRIACAYRGASKAGGYDDRLGVIQAMLVPSILVLGGTTMTGVLLGIVPGWLISPIPLATYSLIPYVASKTPLVPLLLSLPYYVREVPFCLVDGFSRTVGITTFGVDTVLSHPNSALRSSPWSMVLVATLAGGGGGLIVPSFRGFHADWAFSTPSWAADGPGIDIWGATVIGYVYSTLIDAHPAFRVLPTQLFKFLPFLKLLISIPKAYHPSTAGSVPLLAPHEAKIACSLLLATMLATKTLLPVISAALKNDKVKTSGTKAVKSKPSTAVASKKASAANLNEKKSQ